MDDLRPLLRRTLILVAHPDDEAVGCGALLQRIANPVVIFATDGAPLSSYFWRDTGSREEYARVRAAEAQRALEAIGVGHFRFLCPTQPIVDQHLHSQLDRAYQSLAEIVATEMPDAILTLAYEGGHPDHDACSFLASVASQQFSVPVWEMPLYHRLGPTIERQQFLERRGLPDCEISRDELIRKMKMFSEYRTQSEVLREFVPYIERFRPMKAYDFSRPPHAGQLNYEAWQWPMKGSDLCRSFARFLQTLPVIEHQWGTAA